MEPDALKPVPWYLTRRIVFLALTIAGPLALPLVWLSPKFSSSQKIFWTVLTVALTLVFWNLTVKTAGILNQQMAEMKKLGLL